MSYDPHDDKAMTYIGSAGNTWGYNWDVFEVWMHEGGVLHWYSDSGCSCWGAYESTESIDDLEFGSAQDCHAALDEWEAEGYHSLEDHEVADLHADIAMA